MRLSVPFLLVVCISFLLLIGFGCPAVSSSDAEKNRAFSSWLRRFGHKIVEKATFFHRFRHFSANYDKVEEHNRNPYKSYTMALNKFADRTPEEMSKMMGYKPSQDDLHRRVGSTPPTTRPTIMPVTATAAPTPFVPFNSTITDRSLPPWPVGTTDWIPDVQYNGVDWRAVFPSIKSQDVCGSCYIFAACASLEAIHAIKTGTVISLSEQFLLPCTNGCSGGDLGDVFNYMAGGQHGMDNRIPKPLAYTSDYPWTGDDGPSNVCVTDVKNPAPIYVSDSVGISPSQWYKLLNKHPLPVTIDGGCISLYGKGIFNTTCAWPGLGIPTTHAVVLAGYGFDPTVRLWYWLVRNSWGSDWGEAGYIRIAIGADSGNMESHGGPIEPKIEDSVAAVLQEHKDEDAAFEAYLKSTEGGDLSDVTVTPTPKPKITPIHPANRLKKKVPLHPSSPHS